MTSRAVGTATAARWLLLCLLALGVLGMHSLGFGHEGHGGHAVAAEHVEHLTVDADDPDSSDGLDLAAMCLAVLIAVSLALGALSRPLPSAAPRPRARPGRDGPRGWRGPPYSLLVARIAVARI